MYDVSLHSPHTWPLLLLFSSCSRCRNLAACLCQNQRAQLEVRRTHFCRCSHTPHSMKQFTPEQNTRSSSSTLHAPPLTTSPHLRTPRSAGGGRTCTVGTQRWNGTPASLQHKKGAGRPRVLTQRRCSVTSLPPSAAEPRAQPVRYPAAAAGAARQASSCPSPRSSATETTKQEGGRQGKKRTADESECT